MAAAPSHDRRVVGHGLDGFVGTPHRPRVAARKMCRLHEAAEMNVVDHLRPGELPGVAERQPLLRIFLLPAVLDDLAKQPVVVADAVAVSGDPEARHALHEAGGEPPEAAVAERRVGFGRPQTVKVDAEVSERGVEVLAQAEIAQHVRQQPADQELERKIVDALAALGIAGTLGGEPAMDDAVADGECGRHETSRDRWPNRHPCRPPATSLASTALLISLSASSLEAWLLGGSGPRSTL